MQTGDRTAVSAATVGAVLSRGPGAWAEAGHGIGSRNREASRAATSRRVAGGERAWARVCLWRAAADGGCCLKQATAYWTGARGLSLFAVNGYPVWDPSMKRRSRPGGRAGGVRMCGRWGAQPGGQPPQRRRLRPQKVRAGPQVHSGDDGRLPRHVRLLRNRSAVARLQAGKAKGERRGGNHPRGRGSR